MATVLSVKKWGGAVGLRQDVGIDGLYDPDVWVEDRNEWFSNANRDGRIYPEQYRVYRYHESMEDALSVLPWIVVDETGWDGHERVPPRLCAAFETEAAAVKWIGLQLLWSDPDEIVQAALAVARHEKGSFGKLRQAVDWRDK